MKNLKLVALCAVMAVVFGCGKDDKNTNQSTLTGLQGTWATACHGGARANESESDTIQLAGNVFTTTIIRYSAGGCQEMDRVVNVTVTGKLEEKGASRHVAGARNIDEVIDRVEMTPKGLWAFLFNDRHVCGLTTWEADKPTDVSGRDCGFPVMHSGYRRHNIFQLQKDGSLMTGKFEKPYDGGSEETRARILDKIRVFRKK